MPEDETKGTRATAAAPTLDDDKRGFLTTAPADEDSAGQTIVPTWTASSWVSLPDPGYQVGELIGRGGMGEVMVAQDQRIGREVAVKRIRAREPSPDAVSRFLREARIQARLDHPAIVPVYELGTDADGRPYFTMKRVSGETLAKKIGEGEPVQRLLRAFCDVCLAIQRAHSLGVVHRDLKPSNIMLGEYGEVYVLDWGVARVLASKRRPTKPGVVEDVDDSTTAGAILGTPGYMAPEQIEGGEVGPAADLYALGAILFEILTGEPLHPRGEPALSSTLTKPQQAPATRAHDRTVPPELDGACYDALALDAAARPSARQLADRVQAYLDGDRDHERRRALARAQLESAREALEEGGPDARAAAMRRAGRALALDPESAQAGELVSRLMLEPPKQLPPDLIESLDEEERKLMRARSRQGAITYLFLFSFWAVIPFLHVRSWTSLVSFFGLVAVGALVAWRGSKTRAGAVPLVVTWVITFTIVLVFTRVVSPFVLTPIVMCVMMMQLVLTPKMSGYQLVVWAAVASTLPFVFEYLGWIDRTFFFDSTGAMYIVSEMFDVKGSVDIVTLIVANIAFLVTAAIVTVSLNRRRLAAQHELHVQAWHLRQLLPQGRDWKTRQETQRSERLDLRDS